MFNSHFTWEYTNTRKENSYVKRIPPNTELPKSLYKALHVGYEYNEIGYHHKRSGGVTYLIAYTKSGQASLTYMEKEYTIMPGSLLFISLAEDSLIEANISHWEIYFAHIYGSDIEDVYRSVVKTHGYCIEGFDSTVFIESINNVYKMGEQDPYYASGQLFLLLMDLLKQSQDVKSSTLINRAIGWLNAHYMENVTIEMLADAMFVSTPFLIRKFHKELGYTPKQYLMQVRLQKARALLVHTNKTISEIAQESGFVTEKNIFYAFQNILGITPTNYRNNVYKNRPNPRSNNKDNK